MSIIQDTQLVPGAGTDLDEVEDAALSLAAALWKNGQVWGKPLLSRDARSIHLSVGTPCVDALAAEHNSEWVTEELARLAEASVPTPVWSARGEGQLERVTRADWKDAGETYLCTSFAEETSPVSTGDTGEPAALYLLPIEPQLRENLVFWMEGWRNYESLWFGSAQLEQEIYRQLSELDGEMVEIGRRLAREVETATQAPTFCYMKPDSNAEGGRGPAPCPGCGRDWIQAVPMDAQGLASFDYLCRPCRLLSDRVLDPE